jgi:hypothetical protein
MIVMFAPTETRSVHVVFKLAWKVTKKESVAVVPHWPMQCHLQICRLKRQKLTAVVGKLTAEVRYLSTKNRLSCRFNGQLTTATALTHLLLSGQLLIECPFKT